MFYTNFFKETDIVLNWRQRNMKYYKLLGVISISRKMKMFLIGRKSSTINENWNMSHLGKSWNIDLVKVFCPTISQFWNFELVAEHKKITTKILIFFKTNFIKNNTYRWLYTFYDYLIYDWCLRFFKYCWLFRGG